MLPEKWPAKWLKLQHHHPKLQELERECKGFCESVWNRNPIIFTVVGETGTAKTHCLKRVAKYLNAASFIAWDRGYWPRPFTVSYISWSDIAFEDRDDNDMTFVEACDCDVLLLDDIGTEADRYKTSEHKERLRILLSIREPKWTMITTNILIPKWAEVWDQRVEDRLLRGNARPLFLEGVPTFASVS